MYSTLDRFRLLDYYYIYLIVIVDYYFYLYYTNYYSHIPLSTTIQVEKADVSLNIPGLVRFLLAHFRDVPLLKEYLEICKSLTGVYVLYTVYIS